MPIQERPSVLHCIWQQMAQHCMSRAQSKHRQSLQGGKWQYIRSQNLWILLEVMGSDENMKLQLGHDLLPNSVSSTNSIQWRQAWWEVLKSQGTCAEGSSLEMGDPIDRSGAQPHTVCFRAHLRPTDGLISEHLTLCTNLPQQPPLGV